MAKLQQSNRANNRIVYSVYIPTEIITNLFWTKETELILEEENDKLVIYKQ